MRTDELIQAMAADTTRPQPLAVALPAAVLVIAVAVAAVFLSMVGPRPDWGDALMQVRVLLKNAYPPVLALGALGAALRLARPGGDLGPWRLVLFAVPAALAVAVAVELVRMPEAGWMPAMMGQSRQQCVSYITIMGLPLLAGALWALRRGASTRPTLSGAVAGLLAGGAAASVYAIHCTEDSPLFYALWYVLAILAVTAIGAALGSRVLRW